MLRRPAISIRSRLLLTIMLVVGIAAATGYTAVVFWQLQVQKQRMLLLVQSVSLMLGQDLVRIAVLNDATAAADVTARLAAFPDIRHVFLYDTQQRPIFGYHHDGLPEITPPPLVLPYPPPVADDHLHLFLPATYQDRSIGSLYMRIAIEPVQAVIAGNLRVLVIIGAAVVLLTLILARFFESQFNAPLLKLVRFVDEVAHNQDVSSRAHSVADDELGVLARSINALLEQLELGVAVRDAKDRELRNLYSVIDQSPVSVMLTDATGIIEYVNPHFSQAFGHAPADVLGRRPLMLQSAQIEPLVYADILARISAGGNWHGELPARHRTGAIVWQRGVITAIRAADGTTSHFAAIMVDVTAHKKTETAFENAARDLEQLAYSMAHDFQEPVRRFVTFGQLLKKHQAEQPDPQIEGFVDIIINDAYMLRDRLNGARDYLHFGDAARRRPTSVATSLSRALAVLAPLIAETGAEIEYDDLAPVVVVAEAVEVLLVNLLHNALHYRADGRIPRIHVGARRLGEDWEISVRDNGIGIAREHHVRIFEMFRRLHTQEHYAGIGMGLAICRKLVVSAGGSIRVESYPGDGSTFIVTLPAEAGSARGDSRPSSPSR